MRKRNDRRAGAEAGFSLIELMVALGVTLVIMVVASRMLAMTMAVRARENQRAEAIADVQRALQTMSREISNAGLGLRPVGGAPNNGLVDEDSDNISIRVRSNLNAFCGPGGAACNNTTTDPDEDIVFSIISNNSGGETQKLITRQDVTTDAISPLANRVDDLNIAYLNADGTPAAAPSAASRVRLVVSVNLPRIGTPGAPGYQPPSRMSLTSDVVLRNSVLNQ
ncbi:MAG TPA: prepilin-type N-terminal cleavage/methylation domain-containing protein [Pyrinomonadaceae bacterium]|jgi:prepilin-type N-terminal cleavage/methylation domain-containing protein